MGDLLPALLALGLVLALMFGMFWILKRISNGKMSVFRSQGRIKILEKVNLAPDKSLIIVEVDGQTMFLGVSSHGISKISDLETHKIPENQSSPSGMSFLDGMKKIISAKNEQKNVKKSSSFNENEVKNDDEISD